jgi:hypothetical protein
MKSKVDVTILTDEQITNRLLFAERIAKDCKNGLPEHLEDERQNLLTEQKKRLNNLSGDGI